MAENTRVSSILPRVLWRYAILALTYAILIFILPASKQSMQRYDLHPFEYKILLFAIALPSFLAWLAAFVGYARLHDYARSLDGSPEGNSFKQLATGLTWLAWSLPIPTIFALILNSISYKEPGFRASAIIITNYLALLMPLVAFVLIGVAARGLTATQQVLFNIIKARLIIVLFAFSGLLYCYLTFTRFDLSSINSTNNPYYLPLWIMTITIIVPYIYAWFTGLLSAYEIMLFSRNVRGVLYRQALQFFVIGLVIVVLSSIALQYINSASPRVGYLVLGYKLVLTSIFKITTGLGFVVVAVGAHKLKRIEEV